MPSAAPIPQPLATAFAQRKVVLFAGAGMSMPQLPGWAALLEEMLTKSLNEKAAAVMTGEAAIRAAIAAKRHLPAAALLRTGMGERDFCDFLKTRIAKAKGDERHRIAARLPFAAILTTNFDSLLEDAFPPHARPQVIRQNQPTELIRAANRGEFCVIHVHGDVSDSRSIVLAAADYQAVKRDRQIAHCIQTLSATRTFLFAGYGLGDEDLLLFLEAVFRNARGHTGPHYVLEHASKITPARSEEFEKKYGIRFLDDPDPSGHADIRAYLLALEATLPVPDDAAKDAIRLFQEWGCIAIDKVASEGRLLLRAIRQNKFNQDERLALAYVHRAPQQTDIEALAALTGADDRILVSACPAGAGLDRKAVNVFTRDEFIDTLISFGTYRPNIRELCPGKRQDRRLLHPAARQALPTKGCTKSSTVGWLIHRASAATCPSWASSAPAKLVLAPPHLSRRARSRPHAHPHSASPMGGAIQCARTHPFHPGDRTRTPRGPRNLSRFRTPQSRRPPAADLRWL